MPTVEVTLKGKSYPIACAAGEEERLEALAQILADRVDLLAADLPRAGDFTLLLMAALMCEDERQEARTDLVNLRQTAAKATAQAATQTTHDQAIQKKFEQQAAEQANKSLCQAIEGIADYVEKVANSLESV
ncbi:MAG: cell division protein ZapA [Rickettsiales bacterium]|jgi:cell division protein ZapA|nr:cell division protein ZapA [Rickettsiales bacterium]